MTKLVSKTIFTTIQFIIGGVFFVLSVLNFADNNIRSAIICTVLTIAELALAIILLISTLLWAEDIDKTIHMLILESELHSILKEEDDDD